MTLPSIDLARARVLLANDDGISAPGLAVLERVVAGLVGEVWVVAPEHEQSGAGHSLTLRHPLRIRALDGRRYAVDGTPTDCVLLGVNEIMRTARPDLVISGVNFGANLGEDVTYSGTVAAAMEGTLMGLPSIAISLAVRHGAEPHWDTVAAILGDLLPRLVEMPPPANTFYNVNIPNLPRAAIQGVRVATQGQRRLGDNIIRSIDPRGQPYYWIGPTHADVSSPEGTDLHAIRHGLVSVTPVQMDMTDYPTLDALRARLG